MMDQALCVDCSQQTDVERGLNVEGEFFCADCWGQIIGQPVGVSTAAYDGHDEFVEPENDIPWRHIEMFGVVRAFFRTVWCVGRYPTRFFSLIRAGEKPKLPLLFALGLLVFVIPGRLVSYAVALGLTSLMLNHAGEIGPELQNYVTQLGAVLTEETLNGVTVFSVNFAAVGQAAFTEVFKFAVVDIFVAVWVQLFILGRLRKRPHGFEEILQIRCYSLVGQLLALIPLIGLFAGGLATLALNVRGLQVSQRLPISQAILVGIGPFVFLMTLQSLILSFT